MLNSYYIVVRIESSSTVYGDQIRQKWCVQYRHYEFHHLG
jgi:hypothetical protein